jgi:hypothetical protein
MTADVYLPRSFSKSVVQINGEMVVPEIKEKYWLIKNMGSGEYFLTDINKEK